MSERDDVGRMIQMALDHLSIGKKGRGLR
jgi:hypothetical protein